MLYSGLDSQESTVKMINGDAKPFLSVVQTAYE